MIFGNYSDVVLLINMVRNIDHYFQIEKFIIMIAIHHMTTKMSENKRKYETDSNECWIKNKKHITIYSANCENKRKHETDSNECWIKNNYSASYNSLNHKNINNEKNNSIDSNLNNKRLNYNAKFLMMMIMKLFLGD